MVMGPALVALVLVVVNKPTDVETLVAPLARNPDVSGAKDPLVSCMDRLDVGEEIVVEVEVRYNDKPDDGSSGRAGVLVLLQEPRTLETLTTSRTVHPDHWLQFVLVLRDVVEVDYAHMSVHVGI